MPHLWYFQYSLGAIQVLEEVAYRITSKIFGIGSAETNCNYVKLVHRGKCHYGFISSCFKNFLTSSFPLCVQAIVTVPKLNAWRSRLSSTKIPSSLKGFIILITYMIGLIFNKTLVNLLMSLLQIVSLLL